MKWSHLSVTCIWARSSHCHLPGMFRLDPLVIRLESAMDSVAFQQHQLGLQLLLELGCSTSRTTDCRRNQLWSEWNQEGSWGRRCWRSWARKILWTWWIQALQLAHQTLDGYQSYWSEYGNQTFGWYNRVILLITIQFWFEEQISLSQAFWFICKYRMGGSPAETGGL